MIALNLKYDLRLGGALSLQGHRAARLCVWNDEMNTQKSKPLRPLPLVITAGA